MASTDHGMVLGPGCDQLLLDLDALLRALQRICLALRGSGAWTGGVQQWAALLVGVLLETDGSSVEELFFLFFGEFCSKTR